MPIQFCPKLLFSHLSTSTFLKSNWTSSNILNSNFLFYLSHYVLVVKNQMSYSDDRISIAILALRYFSWISSVTI
jgi:hypothetical protein